MKLKDMTSSDIEDRGLIERYWQGSLTPDEEERFEELFLESPELMDELEAERRLRRGFKDMAAEDAVRGAMQLGVLATVARLLRQPRFAALGAMLLAVVLLPSLLLVSQGRQPAPQPLADVPVFALTSVRDGATQPLEISPQEGWLSLALPVEDDPRFESFRVSILRDGQEVFRREDLEPNVLDTLLLTFPADFFAPGEHRLQLEGIPTSPAAPVLLGIYVFLVR